MEQMLLIKLSAILLLGVGAQWLSWRFKLPSILLLLIAGIVAGPVLHFIEPDKLLGDMFFPIVSVAVAVILFEGGLSLRFRELKRGGAVVLRLIVFGGLITWGIGALAAHYVVGMRWELALLLGAVLIVTGPTVIGPLLRDIRPKGDVSTILKWEGIVIDPIGAIIAVLVFDVVISGRLNTPPEILALYVGYTFFAGLLVGISGAAAFIILLRHHLIPDFLQNAVSLMFVVGIFAASNSVRSESGLLAVTVMGVAIANQRWVSVKHIIEFKENLRVLLISTLFILLAARMSFADFRHLRFGSVVLLMTMIFIARPAAVLASTLISRLNWNQRIFIAWMAPRGIVAAAVSSIFAIELAERGISGGEQIVAITFLTIIGTVIVYGLTAPWLANRLGISESQPQGLLILGTDPFSLAIAKAVQAENIKVLLVDKNWLGVREAKTNGLPVLYGSIMSEHAIEEMELEGIGRLLAMTSNDEINSLAALHFTEFFGRAQVYQLKPKETGKRGQETLAIPHLRGRFLFGKEANHSKLNARIVQGSAVIKSANITETFTYRDFMLLYQDDALPLFILGEEGKLEVVTAESRVMPEPGEKIIALIGLEKSPAETG